jgi:putative solute:sodium symporter small subunit
MTDPSDRNDAADTRHWRRSRRLAAGFGLVWLLLSFGPLVFARQLSFEIAGAPLVIWICSLGAPLGFVGLVWRYERAMDRLDRERRAGRVDP